MLDETYHHPLQMKKIKNEYGRSDPVRVQLRRVSADFVMEALRLVLVRVSLYVSYSNM